VRSTLSAPVVLVPPARCWCRRRGAGAAGAVLVPQALGGGSPKADVRHATFVHGARTSQ
jgi:hypothetical protein